MRLRHGLESCSSESASIREAFYTLLAHFHLDLVKLLVKLGTQSIISIDIMPAVALTIRPTLLSIRAPTLCLFPVSATLLPSLYCRCLRLCCLLYTRRARVLAVVCFPLHVLRVSVPVSFHPCAGRKTCSWRCGCGGSEEEVSDREAATAPLDCAAVKFVFEAADAS